MIKWIMNKLSSFFGEKVYRIVVEEKDNQLTITAFRHKACIPLVNAIKKHLPLENLKQFIILDRKRSIIPISNLASVREALQNISADGLEISISDQVIELKQVQTKNVPLHYIWLPVKYCLQPDRSNLTYFGEGWFKSGTEYWRNNSIKSADDQWLHKEQITKKELIHFLKEILPQLKQRHIPVSCDLQYSAEPVFAAQIQQVSDHQVTVRFVWKHRKETITDIPGLCNFVLVENTIMPGDSPARLPKQVSEGIGNLQLSGEEIPTFIENVWPQIRHYGTGQIEKLLDLHRVYDEQLELILVASNLVQDGIGTVQAIPTIVAGSSRFSAEEISRKLKLKSSFVQVENGWIPVVALLKLGIGPMGRFGDGTAIVPLNMKPAEILQRGSERLNGPWKRLEFADFTLPQRTGLTAHFDFLLQWGIPGGFVADLAQHETELRSCISRLIQQNSGCKVLMVGTKKVLDTFASDWKNLTTARYDGNSKDPELISRFKGLIIATPKALENYAKLTSSRWDLLFILEADSLIKSSSSKLFDNLVSCRKALTLGVFTGNDFLTRTGARDGLSKIFEIPTDSTGELVWNYSLARPGELMAAPPKPYIFAQKPITVMENMAEFTLAEEKPEAKSIPIPPRPKLMEDPISSSRQSEPVLEVKIGGSRATLSYQDNTSSFLEEARRLVNHSERKTQFTPFMSYWPTYDSMTERQKKWYFWWRKEVRNGNYPDTDLSYIFLHVYELINDVGVKNPKDGYEQLTNIWSNYRERYPKLDNYLPEWITDYSLIHRIAVDSAELLKNAPNLSGYSPDLLLAKYLNGSLEEMPLELIDSFVDYRIQKSKFYNDGFQEVIQQIVPKILNRVNSFMLKKEGVGIFDIFKPPYPKREERAPFKSALYEGKAKTIVATWIPYSEHQPLRDFMTAIVKHTENKLREINGFNGRLRGYMLDETLRTLIDELINKAFKKEESKQAVSIDMSKVESLTRETHNVQKKLLAGIEKDQMTTSVDLEPISQQIPTPPEPGFHAPIEVTAISRPVGVLKGLLTDLDPVNRILTMLQPNQVNLLLLLKVHNWEMAESQLETELSGEFINQLIDQINEYAYEELGDILLANEGGQWIVADDFRDELEYLLKTPVDAAEEVSTVGVTVEKDSPDLVIPDEWKDFLTHLPDHHITALKAIVQGKDADTVVKQIAEENFMMPAMYIDSINELATEVFGDYLIIPDSSPYEIVEERVEWCQNIFGTQSKGEMKYAD